jgi:acyl transferase domain-containing protein
MLAVRCNEHFTLPERFADQVSLAACNSPNQRVFAGPIDVIAALAAELEAEAVTCTLLPTSHAFHSSMMEPVAAGLLQTLTSKPLAAPKIPMISTVTSTLLSPEQACSAKYWSDHATLPVQFAQAVKQLGPYSDVLLEIGPRATLVTLAKQNDVELPALSSLSRKADSSLDERHFYQTLGDLWQKGLNIKWLELYDGVFRYRRSMPRYMFDRIKHTNIIY